MSEDQEKNRDISPGLLRQRRNLLLSSSIVFLVSWLELSIESVGILGAHVVIAKTENTVLAAAIFHIYFLVRFLQYYADDHSIPSPYGVILSDCQKLLNARVWKVSEASLKECGIVQFGYVYPVSHHNAWYDDIYDYKGLPAKTTSNGFNLLCPSIAQLTEPYPANVDGHCIESRSAGERYDGRWFEIEKPDALRSRTGTLIQRYVSVSRMFWLRCWVKSVAKYLVVRPYFTDYQFPVVLAIISLFFVSLNGGL